MKTLDMRFIRYLNLFEKITRVRTKNCFEYNNAIVFAVHPSCISRAIGEQGNNIKEMSEILGKKIKVISLPMRGIERFIADIVSPVKFKSIEITEREIIINAGKQSKAALIGRNRIRLEELSNVAKEHFGKEIK
ncbi:MAG: KH domain-containing protein, partial [Nanoarchaeota archaeon]|nr:KH domain-containing protein [Nanoarchaeota archaeon]